MTHEVIIDVVTIVVMCVAVFYAARLNRALMRARDGRSELAQLITSLTDAHTKAEAAIKGMKTTAADYDTALQRQIVVSRGLIEELAMMNESSNALANRLERLAPLARGTYEGGTRPGEIDDKPTASTQAASIRADLRADRSDRSVSSEAKAKTWPGEAVAKKAAPSQTTTAERKPEAKPVAIAKPLADAGTITPDSDPGDGSVPRSRAEQELFAAIETLRKGRQS